jgi:hypothetical protein
MVQIDFGELNPRFILVRFSSSRVAVEAIKVLSVLKVEACLMTRMDTVLRT